MSDERFSTLDLLVSHRPEAVDEGHQHHKGTCLLEDTVGLRRNAIVEGNPPRSVGRRVAAAVLFTELRVCGTRSTAAGYRIPIFAR